MGDIFNDMTSAPANWLNLTGGQACCRWTMLPDMFNCPRGKGPHNGY